MGQYYKPTVVNEDGKALGWMYSHDYGNGLKLMEHSYVNNNFVATFESLLQPNGQFHKQRVVWAGDYAEPAGSFEENDFNNCVDSNQLKPTEVEARMEFPYVVNHTHKSFVDKRKSIDNDGWQIHPLPLLTADGNGQGGGDYFGKDPQGLIGSWARSVISVESEVPAGFKEINFDLKED